MSNNQLSPVDHSDLEHERHVQGLVRDFLRAELASGNWCGVPSPAEGVLPNDGPRTLSVLHPLCAAEEVLNGSEDVAGSPSGESKGRSQSPPILHERSNEDIGADRGRPVGRENGSARREHFGSTSFETPARGYTRQPQFVAQSSSFARAPFGRRAGQSYGYQSSPSSWAYRGRQVQGSAYDQRIRRMRGNLFSPPNPSVARRLQF